MASSSPQRQTLRPSVDDTTCPHGEPHDSGIICPACEGPRPRRIPRRRPTAGHGNPFDDDGPLTAAYTTTCRACTSPIRPGDPIAYSDSWDAWTHRRCA